MSCNRCTRYYLNLLKAENSIQRIELLLRAAKNLEMPQDRLDKMAVLHKHARKNYQDAANLNYILDNCEDPDCENW